jgi:cytochrome c oxidase cbb3-type subunit III
MPSTPLKIAPAICGMILVSITSGLVHSQSNSTVIGARRYVQFCSGCHGVDGKGADKASALAANPEVMNLSDTELLRIVRDGTPNGMPPFAQIGDANIAAVVHFLRSLQESHASVGTGPPGSATGDAASGEALFFGKAQCSACHMMRGKGGFIAGNLTTYARNRSANTILQEIIAPDSPLLPSSRVVNVTTNAGQTLTGVLRNEDNFNLALQTEDGRYHFLSRDELTNISYSDHSLMPRDYGSRLAPKDLYDIVSFLIASGKSPPVNAEPDR